MGNANQFVRPFSLAELPAFLPAALDRVAPSRAVMVADQIRAAIANGAAESMVLLVTEPADAIAIVLPQPGGGMATVLHAGPMGPAAQRAAEQPSTKHSSESLISSNSDAAIQLGRTLSQICRRQGISYVQWATESGASESGASELTIETSWPTWMGFEKIGDLRYLSLDFAELRPPRSTSGGSIKDCEPIRLKPIRVPDTDPAMDGLQALIQQTYLDSLDCPTLERFRSVEEIMHSYRDVPSFAPDLWFTLHEINSVPESKSQHPIGCLLMSRHRTNSNPVIELLYMGVVPESRGRALSADILSLAMQVCEQESAQRLILAVDQTNTPAVQAYERIGMQTVLCETVWARKV